MWSIKTDENTVDSTGAVVKRGKVIGWADAEPLWLTDATFVVSRAQHQTGLAGTGKRGTKRNVVAWVTGKIADDAQYPVPSTRVTFHWTDPRSADTGAPIQTSPATSRSTPTGSAMPRSSSMPTRG